MDLKSQSRLVSGGRREGGREKRRCEGQKVSEENKGKIPQQRQARRFEHSEVGQFKDTHTHTHTLLTVVVSFLGEFRNGRRAVPSPWSIIEGGTYFIEK